MSSSITTYVAYCIPILATEAATNRTNDFHPWGISTNFFLRKAPRRIVWDSTDGAEVFRFSLKSATDSIQNVFTVE
jgi:hypothetical protein